MSRQKSCNYDLNYSMGKPKTETEYSANYTGTRSRSKNLKPPFHIHDSNDSVPIIRNANLKLKKIPPQHKKPCDEAKTMKNVCESETGLINSNISDPEKFSTSFDYFDWTGEMGSNLEEPFRNKTSKPKCERASRKRIDLESFQPTDWLCSIKPSKLPFYPQMGDEVMYFRQGHEMYTAAVEHKNLYVINPSSLPRTKNVIRQQEWVKIIGIKYEIKPPRLICLKLEIIDPISEVLTGKCFSIEYHDMDDVPDFLVLKQVYDVAIKRPWMRSQQFRSLMNDDCGVQMWWEGKFIKSEPLDADFPESKFLCYCITWDNGDRDRLSPWDLENIVPDRRPYETGAGVQLLPIDISSTLYTPNTDDWPPLGNRDFECDRISGGIRQVMSLYLAKHFSEPVNLELFPNYAFVVKYPIDLSTIKERLDHRFYRRVTAVEYDVSRIRTNALKFNDPEKSDIVRNSSIITDLCLEIIRNSDLDITSFYLQLLEKYKVRGIKIKGSVGQQPIKNRQIEQSSSFALTFTNVVTGSSQTSASAVKKSRPKLVFNSSQKSSPSASSNRISVKVSSSFTVDEPISDVGVTTADSHKPGESLNHQNSVNSETINTSRMRKKVKSPASIEDEQSPKRRKTASVITPTSICSDDQFSGATIQEYENSVAVHINRNASSTRKSTLTGKNKTKENLDMTCTTSSSLPGIDDDDVQADVTAKSVVHSQNDCSSIDISQKEIDSPRAINKHLNLTRIREKEMGTPLNSLEKTPALFTSFLTPMPVAVSTPMQVHRRQSSLFKNNSLRVMGKRASENLSRNSLDTERRSKHRKLQSGGWSITYDECPKGFVHTLNDPVSQEKTLQTCLSKHDPMFENKTTVSNIEIADLKSCYQSNTILYQSPKVKMTSPLLIAQEISTLDATVMKASYPTVSSPSELDTKSKDTENHFRVECPPAKVTIPSNPNSVFHKEIKSPSSQSADALIEKILSESQRVILNQKTSKNTSEKKKKVSKLSLNPLLSNKNKNCKESLQEYEDTPSSALSAITPEKDTSQSLNKEVSPTPTSFVNCVSCEKDILSSTVEEILTVERQVIVPTSKTSFKVKDKSSQAMGPKQQSVFLEESESPSYPSAEELIEQILAERSSLKQKTSKSEKKKKESKVSAISRLSKVKKDCHVPLKAKSKYRKNDTRNKDLPASSVTTQDEDKNQSVNKEETLTSTNFVDPDSLESDRLSSTVKEVPKLERQGNVTSNETSPKEKDKSSKVIGHNSAFPKRSELPSYRSTDALIAQILAERTSLKQKTSKSRSEKKKEVNQQYMYPEESESTSPQSADALIETILAEANRATLKQKTEKNKSENKKKESKLSTFSRLSIKERGCQEPLKTKSKHRKSDNRFVNDSSASSAIPLEEDQKQLLNKKIAQRSRNVDVCEKDRLTVKAKVFPKKSSLIEGKSSCPQSDDAIVQQILSESKRSILKQNISQKNTSVTLRSLKEDCPEPHDKLKDLGSEENPPNFTTSRAMKIVDQLLLGKLGSLANHQSESEAHILNGRVSSKNPTSVKRSGTKQNNKQLDLVEQLLGAALKSPSIKKRSTKNLNLQQEPKPHRKRPLI